MAFRTDQVLWYNNGVWGNLGYAVPNVGDDPVTLNQGIRYLVEVTGRNLSAVMHGADCDLRRPPTINSLTRIHKLITRARTILSGRQVPANQPEMEGIHGSPAPQDHLIYPVPFFKVRNGWLKEYCGLVLAALGEAVQHTDNRKAFDFGTEFSGIIGQYFHRVYRLMATELFMVPVADAMKLDFTLSDAQLASYDPTKWFTSSELIDTVPPLHDVPTEDDKVVLTDGIPATQLVGVMRWPTGLENTGTEAGGTTGNLAGSFAAPPSP